jgi:putative endonuclease
MAWLLTYITRALRFLQDAVPTRQTLHLRTGRAGETAAYLFLRQQGYRIITTNFRTRANRGEIDLIGWDGDVLCFVEVKRALERASPRPKQPSMRARKHTSAQWREAT